MAEVDTAAMRKPEQWQIRASHPGSDIDSNKLARNFCLIFGEELARRLEAKGKARLPDRMTTQMEGSHG